LKADNRALADLAASVADGEPIDWQHVESRAGGGDQHLVRHLRLVENISSLYRSIPLEEEEPLFDRPAEAAPPASEPDGPRWGRLVLLDQIGRGASSEVFRAWDTELHREAALKLLHDIDVASAVERRERHARVLQEARRLARVRHSNVVQVYGAEEHDGRVGLWMELVRGESLEQIVADRGTFSPAEAAAIGQDLCAALAAVHGSGLLHRDIKAQNVMRESGGRTVLMDFGTGEELKDDTGTPRMAGTPLYVAPEVFRGEAAIVQSDLYSLGVLLFYLVTGKYPVTAPSIEQLARAHARAQKRRLRDVRADLPSSFVQVVERALDADPAKRFRTAGEMEAALREGTARFQTATVEPRSWWRAVVRTPELASLYIAVVALAIAVAAIVWSKREPPTATNSRITSIAVLPLADVSGSSASPYLADALTDQLIATLGQIKAIRVVSRTSVMQFKDSNQINDMFAKLGVDAAVEGTVSTSRGPDGVDRVRVNARLVEASGTVVWSRSFERQLGEALALEAELARAISEGVNAVITPAESRRLTQVRSTNAAAEQAYFQGLHQLNQLGADNMRAAVTAFERAIQLDSSHALAYAGLARARITLGFMRITSQAEARVSALDAASRAVSLDPDSSSAHGVLADLKFYYDWDWGGAEAGYQKAIDLNPSSDRAHSQYARFLIARGRSAEAIAEAERAVMLDPLSPGAASTHALMLYYTRDYDRALAEASHALQLNPGSPGIYFVLSRIHSARGAIDDAIAANERAVSLAGRAATGWRAHMVVLQARAGQTEVARASLRLLTKEITAQHERLGPGQLAYIQIALGEREAALQQLERAAEERDSDLLWLAVDPRVDPLRQEPRFQSLLKTLGVPVLDRAMRLP
jgi:serine/threonine protein kinase/Flp pilus assembly protein TadD